MPIDSDVAALAGISWIPWKLEGDNTVIFQGGGGHDRFEIFDDYVEANGVKYYYSDYDVNPMDYDNWVVNTGLGKDSVDLHVRDASKNVQINTGDGVDYINAANAWVLNLEVNGGNDSDFIVGSSKQDQLRGGAGNDEIFGLDGDDVVYGGSGDDRIHGNNGTDYIFGDAGNDYLEGGSGVDHYWGGLGTNTITDNASNVLDHDNPQAPDPTRYYDASSASSETTGLSLDGNYFPHRELISTNYEDLGDPDGDGDHDSRYTEIWNYS